MNLTEQHVDKILTKYTQGDYYNLLVKAKEAYTKVTGKLDEERDEFEARMNNFDWFIFNYRREDGRRVIDDYIQDMDIDAELARAFHNVKYSLLHFVKINFRGQIIIKDLIHDTKYALDKDGTSVGMVEDDVFVGRIMEYQKKFYLLRGICMLPREVLPTLKKQAQRVRKLNSDVAEENFLLRLEELKTKSLHYGHIDNNKIFVF